MGWQQEQAAARAREQQRQAFQNQQSRQRADQIRAENDAASRRAAQRSRDEGFAQSKARAEQQGRATAAASEKAHRDFMRNQARAGQSWWNSGSSSTARSRSNDVSESYPVSSGKAKSKGGSGAAVLVLLVVGFIVFASSDSHKSTNYTAQPSSDSSYSPVQQVAPEPAPQQPTQVQTAPLVETEPTKPSAAVPEVAEPEASNQQTPTEAQPQVPAAVPPAPIPVAPPALVVVNRVNPQYPEMARLSGLRGTIAVTVEVSPDGSVVKASPEQGNPLLVQAAEDAARKWRFNSYAGQPGDPLRTTTINFKFGDE